MFCKECGAEIPDDSKHCKECGASLVEDSSNTKPEVAQSNVVEKESFFKKNKKILIGCCIGLFVIFLLSGVATFFFGDDSSHDTLISNGIDDYNMSESDFKGMCKEIDYKMLTKNSDKYYGNRTVVSGKVVQIMADKDGGIIRLATDGEYDDIVAVIYSGDNDVVEDDYITAYGYVAKDYSYTSQANYKITIPCIDAKYIEK